MDVLLWAAGAVLGLLAGFVMGIIAIISAWLALRRMAREPGCWLGAWQARIGMALGSASVAAPLLVIVLDRGFR
jgi:hypothetical protein